MAFEKQIEADKQIQQSLEDGLASPSNSSWASPIVLVRKKDQTYRLCVDYWALNAPTFQRLMDRVLAGLQWETCLVYLDDIIVLGKDVSEMLQHLSQVFNRLRQANLKLKPAKCCLFRRQVAYLGHIVSAQGIATDPEKVQKVQQWPEPTCVSEVRQFVGLAAYYRRFVQDFAAIARPLHELTKKNVRFRWTPECQDAFETLKNLLTTTPVLGYPRDSGDLILNTDASHFGIGAVLSQMQDGVERVLAYGSRRLSSTEQNYCTTRRELLAVVEFTRHFRQYLLGRPFIVRSDHSSLRWVVKMKEPEGQLARWLEKLAEYDFEVVHRPGHHHHNADVTSRRPCRPTCPCSMTDPAEKNGKIHHQGVQCNLELHGDVTSPELRVVGVGAGSGSQARPYKVVPKADLKCQTSLDSSPAVERVYVADTMPTMLFNGWTLEELRRLILILAQFGNGWRKEASAPLGWMSHH
ncbi:hypothetical protein NFI96_008107 [Prochilodus magdalenae]|nr:hypothetical protein NFI96_008107 [Prochilodus magdalenae]